MGGGTVMQTFDPGGVSRDPEALLTAKPFWQRQKV